MVEPPRLLIASDGRVSSHWTANIWRARRFSFKLLQARGDTLAKVTGNVDHAWYVPSALKGQFDPAPFGLEKFNVLVFGVMGSGKTSFTNSILALMSRANSGEALPCAERGSPRASGALRTVFVKWWCCGWSLLNWQSQ